MPPVRAQTSKITCSHVCDRSVAHSFHARLAADVSRRSGLHEACQATIPLPMTSLHTIQSTPNHTWIQSSPHRNHGVRGRMFRTLSVHTPHSKLVPYYPTERPTLWKESTVKLDRISLRLAQAQPRTENISLCPSLSLQRFQTPQLPIYQSIGGVRLRATLCIPFQKTTIF